MCVRVEVGTVATGPTGGYDDVQDTAASGVRVKSPALYDGRSTPPQ